MPTKNTTIFNYTLYLLLLLLLAVSTNTANSIYSKYIPICQDIVKGMTIQQKIGQTFQVDFEAITTHQKSNPQQALDWHLGGLLIAGNSAPTQDGNLAQIPSILQTERVKQAYLKKTSENWKKLIDRFKDIGVEVTSPSSNKNYKIKFFLGTHAVHGDQHTLGSVLFPHNIGLSCTHNPHHFLKMGYWTKESLHRTGFNFAYAPSVAVSHNPQWGRFYESMGQQESYIYKYGQAFVKTMMDLYGNQGNGSSSSSSTARQVAGVMSSCKSFFGDGASHWGANQGSASVIDFQPYLSHNSPGYQGAISSQLGAVVLSHGGTNFIPSAFDNYMQMGYLREQLGFEGLTVTDYDEIKKSTTEFLPRTFYNLTEDEGYATIMGGGTDMLMLSSKNQVNRVLKEAVKAVSKKKVLEQRLDEAVARILSVKMAMGLVVQQNGEQKEAVEQEIKKDQENQKVKQEIQRKQVHNTPLLTKNIHIQKQPQQSSPLPSPSSTSTTSSLTASQQQYLDSLSAVQQSLVLIKNQRNTIPFTRLKSPSSSLKYVLLVGQRVHNINQLTHTHLFRSFDNIGMQCGGWTIRKQGFEGNDFWEGENKKACNATSILDGLKTFHIVTDKEQQKGEQPNEENFQMIYPHYTTLDNQLIIEAERRAFLNILETKKKQFNSRNTLILSVVGQYPYAQTTGDVNIPYCKHFDNPGCIYRTDGNPYARASQPKTLQLKFSNFEQQFIDGIRSVDSKIPMITVMLSGRPMLVQSVLEQSDAFIAAWLPGTSGGQGIMNAIVGDYAFRPNGDDDRTNTLSFDWPKNMDTLSDFPIYDKGEGVPKINEALYSVGYGLSTKGNEEMSQKEEEKVEVKEKEELIEIITENQNEGKQKAQQSMQQPQVQLNTE